MKKTYKILSMAIMAVMILSVLSSSVFALSPASIKASATSADDTIQTIGGKILSAVTTAGIVLSVLMLAILGVKYMLGSSEEKAEYKKSMMPYLIGSLLVFAASTIATAVNGLFTF